MENLIVNTDGGSRGNPGQAAIGVAAQLGGRTVFEISETIGIATNNEAEYKAVLAALSWLEEDEKNQSSYGEIRFLLDSKLVVEQLNRNWKIKEPRLLDFAKECWKKISSIPRQVSFKHIPRAENSAADALVNQALDAASE